MGAFEIFSYVGFAAVIGGIIFHKLSVVPAASEEGKSRSEYPWAFWNGELETSLKIRRVIVFLMLVGFAGLVVTGFAPKLLARENLHGYTLMVHVGLAPLFIVCLTIAAILQAYQCRLDKHDRKKLGEIFLGKFSTSTQAPEFGKKITFWIVVTLALPVALSMVVGMFPIFGTHGQETLLAIHQFSALGLSLALLLNIYLTLRIAR